VKRQFWSLMVVTLAIVGCTKMCGIKRSGMTPEQVVEAYLQTALNMDSVSDRDILVDYTTGNLKNAIESATPETIKAAYVDRKYTLKSYSVVQRNDRTPRETEIVFQLEYLDHGTKNAADDTAPSVTTENTVSVIKEGGAWYIRDVVGNKTGIDFPVSDESKITAKAGVITEPDLEKQLSEP
jgi:hypothetical protein